MINYLIIVFSSFLFFFLSEKISKIFSFIDLPDRRRVHKEPTSNMGGLAIILIILTASLMTKIPSLVFSNIIIYSCVAGIVGLADDKYQFSPFKKTFLISIPIVVLILKGISINNLGIYYGIGYISLGPWAEIFTFFCCYIAINAFNYSDGIDGQSSSMFISSMILIIILIEYFNISTTEIPELIKFLKFLIISLIVYFFFNHKLLKLPKLFMGNSGSLLLGFFLSYLIIFIHMLGVHFSLVIWTINIIIFDFFATTIIRMIKARPILEPSLDHFHHQLVSLNLSSITVNIVSFIMNTTIGLIGLLIFIFTGGLGSLISFVVFFLIFFFIKKNYLYKNF